MNDSKDQYQEFLRLKETLTKVAGEAITEGRIARDGCAQTSELEFVRGELNKLSTFLEAESAFRGEENYFGADHCRQAAESVLKRLVETVENFLAKEQNT